MRAKVFGIGFHKTGTTSLASALRKLGYRVTGPDFATEAELGDNLPLLAARRAEEFDAFQDGVWPILFRQMDQRFPGSKFILTVRDTDHWYASVLQHFGTSETPRRRRIYGPNAGSPVANEDIYKATYEAHNRDVVEYFAARPHDLLVMDLSGGDGWEKLCPFLGRAIPHAPFPHRNPKRSRAVRALISGVARTTGPLRARLRRGR